MEMKNGQIDPYASYLKPFREKKGFAHIPVCRLIKNYINRMIPRQERGMIPFTAYIIKTII